MYRSLKAWKMFDMIGQLAIGLVPFIWSIFYFGRAGGGMFVSLFGLGGWQLLSFFLTLFNGRGTWKSPLRKLYTVLLGLLAVIGLTATLSEEALALLLYSSLVAGPVLAVLYLIVSILEWRNLKKLAGPTNDAQ